MFGGLGGDFYKDTYEPKLFGMLFGSVLRGWNAKNANIDLKMSILPMCRVGNAYAQGQMGRFFDVWRPWRGLL